jgi:hypothetical protein
MAHPCRYRAGTSIPLLTLLIPKIYRMLFPVLPGAAVNDDQFS